MKPRTKLLIKIIVFLLLGVAIFYNFGEVGIKIPWIPYSIGYVLFIFLMEGWVNNWWIKLSEPTERHSYPIKDWSNIKTVDEYRENLENVGKSIMEIVKSDNPEVNHLEVVGAEEVKDNRSTTQKIQDRLENGDAITTKIVKADYDYDHLPKIIYKLKKKGFDIRTRSWEDVNEKGKRTDFKEYFLNL